MKKHITIRFALVIGLVEIVALTALFLVLNMHITRQLENKVISDMRVIARDRAELVESYIRGCINYVDEYSHLPEAVEALENPNDSEVIEKVREITNEVASDRSDIEGLYVAQWDTYVLAHINPDYVDKTFRDADGARELEEKLRKAGTGICTGIVQAPVTKKKVIPIYAPVNDKSGEMIGFVGAAFYADTLSDELQRITENEKAEVSYSLIDAANNTYIFDNDEELAGQPCEDENILNAINDIHKKAESGGFYDFTEKGNVVSCYYMANRDWLFVVSDASSDVFGVVGKVRIAIIIICVAVALLTIIATVITSACLMRPARAISDQIHRIKDGDFSHGHTIEKYAKREDEFGAIASAVDELQDNLENQYELFLEILKVQTVGTLVTRSDNNEVVLANDRAMEFMNLDGSPEEVTIPDIRNAFDEEALAIVDEEMAKIINGSTNEICYELTISDGGKVRHLLTNAKQVVLSNNDVVIIMSLTDITDRKLLEDNLKILSETDSLTRICNRRSGEAKIKEMMAMGRYGMFALFDVDKFKHYNDTFGHGVGDQILIKISDAMKRSFRTSDILIRLGGDEFVAFAVGMPDEKTGCMVIERFLEHISMIEIDEMNGEKVAISLGAVLIDDDEKFEDMYAKADSAMYECKEKEGNSYHFFHEK